MAKCLTQVRVEDETSIGRAYSKQAVVQAGLGQRRRELRSTAWQDAYAAASSKYEAFTLTKVHLSAATREDVAAYFQNAWENTNALFSALRDDSVFYAVPDKLRRPLIFYAGHTAAVYINKLHLAGLLGEWAEGSAAGFASPKDLSQHPTLALRRHAS